MRAAARAGRDLAIVGGRCVVVEGVEALAEAVRARLDLRLGGYAFDPRAGMDQRAALRSPSACEAEFERAILGVPGVTRCRAKAVRLTSRAEAALLGEAFALAWDAAGGRLLAVRWTAEGRPGSAAGASPVAG